MQQYGSRSQWKRLFIFTAVFAYFLLLILYTKQDKRQLQIKSQTFLINKTSTWIFKHNNRYQHRPAMSADKSLISLHISKDVHLSLKSPYIINSLQNNSWSTTKNIQTLKNTKVKKLKTVAVFDPLNQHKNFLKGDSFNLCKNPNCKAIKSVELADAVIFIMPKIKIPPNFIRKVNQIWIFYTIEAPSRVGWFSILDQPFYKSGFNVTVSYNLKSDIPNLYGNLAKVKQPPQRDYNTIYNNKSKMAAWFVSHCKTRSERMKFVGKMKSRMDVDIFGDCGTKMCRNPERPSWGKHEREMVDESTCFPMLSAQYKFYLAFENTMCREYITEKFFKLFQNVDIIPVVRGGADYQKYLPKDMYVDTSDFSTPENLADFLVDLADDKDRYIQYLKNKDRYYLTTDPDPMKCRLCEKLNSMDHVVYSNIRDWWTQDACYDPRDSLRFW